jgi:hypothetical protein
VSSLRIRSARLSALLVIVTGLLTAQAVMAAGPRLEVRLKPPRIGIEDVAQLEVRVVEPPTGLGSPSLGELTNLEVVGGPSRGTEFSFINGVATSSVTFSYLVRGLEEGPASVGPITVAAGDQQFTAEAVSAEIVPGSVAPPRSRRRPRLFDDPFEDLFQRRRGSPAKVVLRHLLGAKTAIVGEPVMATVVLDSTHGISGIDWIAAPSYPGWWAQRIDPPKQISSEVVEFEGVRFNRYVVSRHVLVPLKAGVLMVPQVQARVGVGSRSPFAAGEILECSTTEIEARVGERPLPPEGYAGAVGQLRYGATLEPEEIDFGSSAVLTISVTGTGNLPLVEAPSTWPSCADCETYPPEEESQITVDQTGIRGSRSWRTTVVPRQWGSLHFESVVASVFDPDSGAYRRQTLGPLTLEVVPPPPTPTPVVEQAVDGDHADAPEEGGARDGSAGVPATSWLWIVGALFAGLGLGALVVWLMGRRRGGVIPPRRMGQSPAERARELQVALERWWLDVRAKGPRKGVAEEMEQLRRELEAVRFAPGRADHTETIAELEDRLRRLLKRA